MDLALTRLDYAQIGNIKSKCMKLLPQISKDPLQKIAIVGNDGIFQILQIKKSSMQPLFKATKSSPVNCLNLGGQNAIDKIFVCDAGLVRGFKRNGEQFLNFPHDSIEPPFNMYIEGNNLFLTSTYTYHHFVDCKEIEYYLCPDKIHDLLCLPVSKQPVLSPIIACNDNTIKVIEKSDFFASLKLSSCPLCLCLYKGDGGPNGNEILFGMSNGVVGLAIICREVQTILWEIPNYKNHLGVILIDTFDLTGNQIKDIIIAREDNSIEVYCIEDQNKPRMIYSVTCNESITSLQAGFVSSAEYPEIIYTTYSGWICSLTTQPPATLPKLVSTGEKNKQSTPNAQTIALLNKEISELKRQIEVEQSKVKDESSANVLMNFDMVNIADKLIFNSSDATYVLVIEVDTSIEYILLQSDKVIDILESERNLSVLSYSPCQDQDGNKMLATYRFMANTARIEIKFRSVEDGGGTVHLYITPRVKPQVCYLKTYQIKPLSLHQRSNDLSEIQGGSKLTLQGNFSYSEIHSWLVLIVPDLPDRTPVEEVSDIYLTNCFVGTRLHITYKKGEATFVSDNVSTITLVKEAISCEATRRGTKIDVSYELNDESAVEMLKKLNPKFEYHIQLSKKVSLIDGLKELQVQEGVNDSLSEEYKEILANSDKLIAELKMQPNILIRLKGIVSDLYNCWCKLKAIPSKGKLAELYKILENYNLNDLIAFFS